MATQITDEEDKLRRRARRRLIGAVTLTLVVIIVLPMVLDSEPKPAGQNIELTIPDKDKVGEFVPKMALPAVSAPTAATPVLPAVAPVADMQPVSAAAAAAAQAEQQAKPAQSKEQSQPGAKPGANSAAKPEPKPDTSSETKADAKPAVKPASKESGASKSGFVVQIGAFSKAATAESWRKKLSKRGFRVYTEHVDDKVRVRVGPYPTREAAEKPRHKLEAEGLHPNIVELHE